jgi:ribosomal protein L14
MLIRLRSFLSLVMPAVVVRQRKPWRRRDGVYLYFEGAFS